MYPSDVTNTGHHEQRLELMLTYEEADRLIQRAALAMEAGQFIKAEQLVNEAATLLRRLRGYA